MKRQGESKWQATKDGAMKVTPTKLKNAQLALVAGVNGTALLVSQQLLTELVHPQHRNRQSK